jgi:hypothetical protein
VEGGEVFIGREVRATSVVLIAYRSVAVYSAYKRTKLYRVKDPGSL